MAFNGWPATMTAFYDDLEISNTKEWWSAHKAAYDADVRAPMEALIAAVGDEFGEAKLFRPYRDVRFSADKTPYKLECGAMFGSTAGTGFYARVSAAGIGAGGGMHTMAADQLGRYRAAIDDDRSGAQAAALVADLEAAGYMLHGEALKTAPRGYPKDHPRIDLLRRRGLFWFRESASKKIVHSAKALDWVTETFRAGKGLIGWLDDHVGPSTADTRRR